MKKLFIIIVISMISHVSTAQEKADNLQYITNICYDVVTTNHIRVSDELDTSTLSILDKLKFKKKEYVQKHSEYLDAKGNVVSDITFISHTNMFPKWYTHPEMIRIDKNGTKSFFSTTNKYLKDGWVGGSVSKTKQGEYFTDKKTGENIYQQEYSILAQDSYTAHNAKVNELGYLYKYVFKAPTTDIINQFKKEGYIVIEEKNIISIKNDTKIIVWDTLEKVVVNQIIEGDEIIETTKTQYSYVDEYKNFLISKKNKITPNIFDNGDYYEVVKETEFFNFTSQCKGNNKNSNKTNNNEGKENDKLSVYPNPSLDLVVVSIPRTDKPSILKMTDFLGKIILQRKIDAGLNYFELNTAMIPSGVYTINVYQGNKVYASKLIKK